MSSFSKLVVTEVIYFRPVFFVRLSLGTCTSKALSLPCATVRPEDSREAQAPLRSSEAGIWGEPQDRIFIQRSKSPGHALRKVFYIHHPNITTALKYPREFTFGSGAELSPDS